MVEELLALVLTAEHQLCPVSYTLEFLNQIEQIRYYNILDKISHIVCYTLHIVDSAKWKLMNHEACSFCKKLKHAVSVKN